MHQCFLLMLALIACPNLPASGHRHPSHAQGTCCCWCRSPRIPECQCIHHCCCFRRHTSFTAHVHPEDGPSSLFVSKTHLPASEVQGRTSWLWACITAMLAKEPKRLSSRSSACLRTSSLTASRRRSIASTASFCCWSSNTPSGTCSLHSGGQSLPCTCCRIRGSADGQAPASSCYLNDA